MNSKVIEFEEKFSSKYIVSLHDASREDKKKNTSDDTFTEDQYMTEQQFKVIKIDDFNKECYQSETNHSFCLPGVDAFFKNGNTYYFIEFKNGYLSKRDVYHVLEKMYASAIVIMDKLEISMNDFKSSALFALVYNSHKNQKNSNPPKDRKKNEYYPNEYMLGLDETFREKTSTIAKERDNDKLGLDKLEKYLYNEVVLLPEKWLEQFLKDEKII